MAQFKMATYTKLGSNGRLGNQLFQIAAVVGAVNGHLSRMTLPPWKYAKDFAGVDDLLFNKVGRQVDITNCSAETDAFQYMKITSPAPSKMLDINGYRQNQRYFSAVIHKIREIFRCPAKTRERILNTMPILKTKHCIGMHVRRGDYISTRNRPIYDVCTEAYYRHGIAYWRSVGGGPVIVISDDIPWCQETFGKDSLIFFSPFTNEVDDLFALSFCPFTILSNSSFSFWGAFLGGPYTKTIAPWPWIKDGQDFREIYLQEWRVVDVATGTARQKGGAMHGLQVGAYYQCYKQPVALIASLASFRLLCPSSSLHMVCDGGGDYCKNISQYFNASHFTMNMKRLGNGVSTALQSIDKAAIFMKFFIQAAQRMPEEYFVLLKDDTCMINRLKSTNWWGRFDIIGCNRNRAKLNAATMKLLPVQCRPASSYYGGCGGSLFRTRFWANIPIDLSILHAFGVANKQKFHSDILLSFLCLLYGGTISNGPPQQLVESEKAIRDDTFILHQYKNFYNNQPSENNLYIMNWVKNS